MRDYYDKVKEVLETRPETRDDDMKLYSLIVHRTIGLPPNVTFYEATFNHRKYNLPSYESVTRARRKIQELEPHLRGTRRKARMKMEEEYREKYSPRR